MKKIILFSIITVLSFSAAYLYGSNARRSIQLADVFVCESQLLMAELQAKVNVNRSELYIASYCNCESVDPGIREHVEIKRITAQIDENGKIVHVNEVADCKPPRDQIYFCVCVGRSSY